MNRIILIGNGFDLAHGMKTSYSDFINDYWLNIISDIKKSAGSSFENSELKITQKPLNAFFISITKFEELYDIIESRGGTLTFKNKFLEKINKKKQTQNWVDIENEYYLLLKESFKDKKCEYKISQLNSDFTEIQRLLEKYLEKIESNFKNDFGKNTRDSNLKEAIVHKVYSNFKFKDFSEESINKKVELEYQEIKDVLDKSMNSLDYKIWHTKEKRDALVSKSMEKNKSPNEIRKRLLSDSASNYYDLQPSEILFLNFNYTFTEGLYSNLAWLDLSRNIINNKNLERSVIHIHGTTDQKDNNNVIFGFGDELDEDYKSIENLNDNIYLENIKSIKYLETDNYKKLLEFLNSDDYQIFIFGHSCGNSDRTLLSTLFEHKHCVSIKPFYHKRENDDNYSEIVRNITRNFNNKAVLRDKVVNKEYCEPLT
ncbi:AbiH family protein [Flavobacterium poyangense]|uniref:AbiH family protein n=1 Tax=Flavobacterium poyangense TaxID=2204302 RepID=UPI00142075E8|nr:AbiH family protein [Flavobacterium sp. JXAS1]